MVPRWLTPLVAATALILSVVAIVLARRPADDEGGRVVQAATLASYQPLQPVRYVLDDFELMPLAGGRVVALYIYPPGFQGHVYGCTIRWEPTATFEGSFAGTGATPLPAAQSGPVISVTGPWVDNCGGTKWDAEGRRLFGPGPRDLDRFPVTIDAAGTIRVDTRRLQCQGEPCERVWGRR